MLVCHHQQTLAIRPVKGGVLDQLNAVRVTYMIWRELFQFEQRLLPTILKQ